MPLQAAQLLTIMADVEQGSATTPRSPREVRPPTPEQMRAARNKLPEAPAAPVLTEPASPTPSSGSESGAGPKTYRRPR